MTYELAKQLKENGWPQDIGKQMGVIENNLTPTIETGNGIYALPTLSEIIEACPKPLQITIMPNGFTQACWLGGDGLCCHYYTPEEAVANLWLALNKK